MDDAQARTDRCELCGRRVAVRTRHHLIPRTRHRNKRNKRMFERKDVRERVAWVCKPCHKQIHTLLDAKQLELTYNTIERLAAHPDVARFVDWIRDKPDGTSVPARRTRGRRGGTGRTDR